MKQSRTMSLVESVANVIVGYGVAVLSQILIFPVFGLHTTLAQNLQMGLVFTVVSVARSFALRRVFEAIRIHTLRRNRRGNFGSTEAGRSCNSGAGLGLLVQQQSRQ